MEIRSRKKVLLHNRTNACVTTAHCALETQPAPQFAMRWIGRGYSSEIELAIAEPLENSV